VSEGIKPERLRTAIKATAAQSPTRGYEYLLGILHSI